MVNKWVPIAVGGGLTLLGVGVVSALFTTPTASTGSLSYGFVATPETIKAQIEQKINEAPVSVVLNENTTVNTTFAEIGVTASNIDELSSDIYSHDLIWKVGNWWSEPEISFEPTVDTEKYNVFLETHLNEVPQTNNAQVIWEDSGYKVVPSTSGLTFSLEEVSPAFKNIINGQEIAPTFALIPETPNVVDEEAQKVADEANQVQSNLTVQAGTQNVKINYPEALFNFQEEGEGLIKVSNDEALNKYAELIPNSVNREAKNGEVIVDSQDNILWTVEESHSGLKVTEDNSSIVSNLQKVLSNGETVLNVKVDEVAPVVDKKFRRMDVNLTEQKVRLYENEQIVHEWAVSSGKAATPTDKGNFKVRAFVRIQDMVGDTYRTPDVPWVVYFNGDEAFHGAYWHNNFGTPMSHGCVNLPIPQAEQLYRFAYVGMEVSVHD